MCCPLPREPVIVTSPYQWSACERASGEGWKKCQIETVKIIACVQCTVIFVGIMVGMNALIINGLFHACGLLDLVLGVMRCTAR